MTPTEAQLRWMRAIYQFWMVDQWYPGVDDLLDLMELGPYSQNAGNEMLERLEKKGWIDWPLNVKRVRSKAKGDRLCRRANSIRLTASGLSVLKENS